MSKPLEVIYVGSSQQEWTGVIFSQSADFEWMDVCSKEAGHSVQHMS